MISQPAEREAVVLGVAVGYGPDHIEPFVTSLRNTGYRGDVVLFVDAPLRRVLRGRHRYRDVILRPTARYLPWRLRFHERSRRYRQAWGVVQGLGSVALAAADRLPLSPRRRAAAVLQLVQRLYPPTESRYFHFHHFLTERPYARVLLSDVRDVVFQSDPFEQLPVDGLATGIETPRYTLATEPFNRMLVERVYGASGLARIGDRPISCCGVTAGDRDSIRRYLEAMMAEIRAYGREAARRPTDQAPHNHLLWTGQLGEFHRCESLAGPIATLAMHDEHELELSDDGRLLNRDGTVPSIVHQYDRWPEVERTLLRTHAGGEER